MPLGPVPERRREPRLPTDGVAVLFAGSQGAAIVADLRDAAPCGLGLRHQRLELTPGNTYLAQYNHEQKRFRGVWVRRTEDWFEAGLVDEDVFLIERVRAGETECFQQLVAPYKKSLHWTVRAILFNRADEEEAVQEALLKAMSHLHQFRAGQNFRSWLLRIAANEALKCVARRNRLGRKRPKGATEEAEAELLDELVDQIADSRETPAEALERKELAQRLFAALDRLDDIYRDAFVLHHLHHLPVAQVAKLLGINLEAANTRLYRARLQMRAQLRRVMDVSAWTSNAQPQTRRRS